MQSEKMDGRCPKDTNDYMSFHDFFCQLQQFITLSIFGNFEWFMSQNVIQELYFMPYFLLKSKFQVEGYAWMQNILGHF